MRLRFFRSIEKSNQLWTTFTIHKQNLLAHCYALKRLNDEDEARNLYQIATKEKIVLLKLLQAKIEESHVKMQQDWVIWQMMIMMCGDGRNLLADCNPLLNRPSSRITKDILNQTSLDLSERVPYPSRQSDKILF